MLHCILGLWRIDCFDICAFCAVLILVRNAQIVSCLMCCALFSSLVFSVLLSFIIGGFFLVLRSGFCNTFWIMYVCLNHFCSHRNTEEHFWSVKTSASHIQYIHDTCVFTFQSVCIFWISVACIKAVYRLHYSSVSYRYVSFSRCLWYGHIGAYFWSVTTSALCAYCTFWRDELLY